MLPSEDFSVIRIKREPNEERPVATLNCAHISSMPLDTGNRQEPSADRHTSQDWSSMKCPKVIAQKATKMKQSSQMSSPTGIARSSQESVVKKWITEPTKPTARPPRMVTPDEGTTKKRKSYCEQHTTPIPRKKTKIITANRKEKLTTPHSTATKIDTPNLSIVQHIKKESISQGRNSLHKRRKTGLHSIYRKSGNDQREINTSPSISLAQLTSFYNYVVQDGVDSTLIHTLFRRLGFLSNKPLDPTLMMQAVDSDHVFAQECMKGLFHRLEQSRGTKHQFDSPAFYSGIWMESGFGKLCTDEFRNARKSYALRVRKCVRILLSEVQHDTAKHDDLVTSLFLACLKTRKCRGTYKSMKPLFALLTFDKRRNHRCPNPFLDNEGNPTGWSSIASAHLSTDAMKCLQGKALCELIKPAEEAFVALVVLKYLFGEICGSRWPTHILRYDDLDLATWVAFKIPVVTPWSEEFTSSIEFSLEDHTFFFKALGVIADKVKHEALVRGKKKLSYRYQFPALQDENTRKLKAAKKAGKGIAILDYVRE